MAEAGVRAVELVDLESEDFASRPAAAAAAISGGRGSTKRKPISVEDYAEERDLERAIAASLSRPSQPNIIDLSSYEHDGRRVIDVDDYYDGADVLAARPGFPSARRRRSSRKKGPFSGTSVIEIGESSNPRAEPPPTFMCEICAESKDVEDSFHVQGCTHSYCKECMGRYVASKLQDNITSIKCPEAECCGRLEPEHCRSILPQEVFDRWGTALCEALILGSEKFYCPFKDCSAMLINDGSVMIAESECPYCNRLFCARCRVPWHDGIACEEFQKLNKDEREREDIMLKNLASEMKWIRCPTCGFFVQKVVGCDIMTCRCGGRFCYRCGNQWKVTELHKCALPFFPMTVRMPGFRRLPKVVIKLSGLRTPCLMSSKGVGLAGFYETCIGPRVLLL